MDDTSSASEQPTQARTTLELAGTLPVVATRVGQQMGKYRLVQLLANGGFAEVYLGEHVYLTTQAAIKILHARLTTEELERFREEARIVARLRHPHIINIHDFDVQDGTPFIVMDYAPNGTLRQRHARHTTVSETTVLLYVRQIAEALQYAHINKLIHRDVKPENMLVGHDNEILLSDFGIAVVVQTSRAEIEHSIIGTVSYMSPEQFKGQALPASDQYALAVVLYEWLCGRCPFQGTITEIMAQHIYDEPAPLRVYNPQISLAVEQVILKALSKNPEQRYPTMLDFAHAFENTSPKQTLLTREPILLRENGSTSDNYAAKTLRAIAAEGSVREGAAIEKHLTWKKRFSRRSLLFGLGGVTVLGLTGSGLVWFVRTHTYRDPKALITPTTPPTPTGTLLLTYHSHTDTVNAVAWSPSDGSSIASASRDKTVRVWSVASGADTLSYTGHSDIVNAVAWALDGQHVASGGNDKTVQIWPVSSANDQPFSYQGHSDTVNCVIWLTDGSTQYIASASNDKTVRIWKRDGSDITTYTEHTDAVRTVALSPDGKYIASGGEDKTGRVWPAPISANNSVSTPDTASPTAVAFFQKHSAGIRTLTWSPDGKYIASGGEDNMVFIWYALIGGNPLVTYQGHSAPVNAVSWSPDGNLLASASDDGTVHIWQASDGSKQYVYSGHSTGSPNIVTSVIWSPDGATLASAGVDRTVQVWHA